LYRAYVGNEKTGKAAREQGLGQRTDCPATNGSAAFPTGLMSSDKILDWQAGSRPWIAGKE
jgi:hypothetical protein